MLRPAFTGCEHPLRSNAITSMISSSLHPARLDHRGVIVECPNCHQQNRLPYEYNDRKARCTRCQSDLPAVAAPIEVSLESDFEVLVSRSALPVLVDFWAAWCGPCKMMAGEFTKAAADGAGRWLSVKVDTDALTVLAQRYRIQALPTLALFKAGQIVSRKTGARPAQAIRIFAESNL